MQTLAVVFRKLRLFLTIDPGARRTPSDFSLAAKRITWLARFFYLSLAFFIQDSFIQDNFIVRFGDYADNVLTDPLWLVSLITSMEARTQWYDTMVVVLFLTTLLAVVFPGVLACRLGVFVGLLLTVAMHNSYGLYAQGQYFFIYASLAFLFLPAAISRADNLPRPAAMRSVMVFWFVQSALPFVYFLSGLQKIMGMELSVFDPDRLLDIPLVRMFSGQEPIVPILLPPVVEYKYFAQFFSATLIGFQFFSIFVPFRPHLHRIYGVILILFHLGAEGLMHIGFSPHIVMWGLFFVFSPFAPKTFSWSGLAQSLPVLGIPFRLCAALRSPKAIADKAWLVYDGECPFCSRYADYLRVKKFIGELVLVNAREAGPVVEEIKALPWDLNQGMVLKINGRYHFGSDALQVLALLSDGWSPFNFLNRLLFSLRGAAWFAYPLLKLGRRMALKFKGVALIE